MGFYPQPHKRTTKRDNQEKHAQRRLYERFGVSGVPMSKIVRMIISGQSRLIERQSVRVALHAMTLNGVDLVAVYDRRRKMIVTFLYPNEEYKEIRGRQ